MKTKQLITIIIILFIGNILMTGCGSWRKLASQDVELSVEQVQHKDSLTQLNHRSEHAAIYEWLQSSAFSTAVIWADSTLTIHPDNGIQLDRGSIVYLHRNQYQREKAQELSVDEEDRLTQLQENTYHQSEEIGRTINQRSRHPPNPFIWIGFFCCLFSLIAICYWNFKRN